MTSLAAIQRQMLPRLLPRLLPGAIALLLGGTLLCATLARLERSPVQAQAVIASEQLKFADTSDGAVLVTDAASNRLVARVPARSGGFLRMVLRLMAGARARQNIGASVPFLLTQRAGGHLQLADPATGELIELEAFGPSNVAEFAILLEPQK